MSLTWHIIRKDFRRMGWAVGLWLAWPAIQWVLLGLTIDQTIQTAAAFGAMTHWFNVMVGIHALVGFILAAWLVMEDDIVSAGSFWRTRPIAKARLFAAKIIGAGLIFGLLPLLMMAPLWLQAGFSGEGLERAALGLLLMNCLFVLPAMAIASVSATPGQFMARMLGVAVLGFFVVGYCAGILGANKAYLADGVAETRYRIVLGIFIVMVLAVIVHQYLTLRRARSQAMVLGGVALMFLVRWGPAWDLTQYFRDYPGAQAASTPVQFGEPRARIEQRPGDASRLIFEGKATGIPSGSYLQLSFGRGWQKAAEIPWPGARYYARAEVDWEQATREAAGFGRGRDSAADWHATGTERREHWARSEGVGAYELALEGMLMRGQALGSIPLQAGEVLETGGSRTRIAGVERVAGRLVIQIEERDLQPPWTARPHDSYVLVNAAGSLEAVLGSGQLRGPWFHWISVRQRILSLELTELEANSDSGAGIADSEGLRLVKVRFSPDATFTTLVPVTLPALPTP